MIHYDEIRTALVKLKPGELLILRVEGMLSPGKNLQTGEPLLPKLRNGTLVRVVKGGLDNVTVATEDGQLMEVLAHTTGARHLSVALDNKEQPLKAFPTAVKNTEKPVAGQKNLPPSPDLGN
jgi:urease accessory protein UreE